MYKKVLAQYWVDPQICTALSCGVSSCVLHGRSGHHHFGQAKFLL